MAAPFTPEEIAAAQQYFGTTAAPPSNIPALSAQTGTPTPAFKSNMPQLSEPFVPTPGPVLPSLAEQNGQVAPAAPSPLASALPKPQPPQLPQPRTAFGGSKQKTTISGSSADWTPAPTRSEEDKTQDQLKKEFGANYVPPREPEGQEAADLEEEKAKAKEAARVAGLTPMQRIHEANLAATQAPEQTRVDTLEQAKLAQEAAMIASQKTTEDQDWYRKHDIASQADLENKRQTAITMAQKQNDFVTQQIQQHINQIQDVDPRQGLGLHLGDRSGFTPGQKTVASIGDFGVRVGGAIAMALGAYGAGITHSHNFAMEIIDNAIKSNMDAQKANIDKAWQKVNTEYKLGNDQKLKNDFTIEQYSRVEQMQHELYKQAIEGSAAKSNNAQVQANAANLVDSLQAKSTQVQQERVDRMTNFQIEEYKQQLAQQAAPSARAQKLLEKIDDLSGKFISEGVYTNPDQARAAAARAYGVGNQNPISQGGSKGAEQTVINANTGKPQRAVSKDQAEIYNKALPAFNKVTDGIKGLEDAIARGDTKAQKFYRGALQDDLTMTKGIARLPSMGNLEKVMPELLPDVHGTVGQYVPTHDSGNFTTNQTVQTQQLNRLKDYVAKARQDLEQQTFGAPNGPDVVPGQIKR